MKTILVVDDELGSRVSLAAVLSPAHRVVAAASAAEASAFLGRERPDLLLLDVMMPDKDGVTFLREVQQGWPELPVVMISASTRIRPAVDAIQSGALDYVTKPFDVDDLRRVVARALERSRLHRQVEAFRTDLEREYPVDRIVGRAPSFLRTVEEARQAARTDATVLICGESGTGKELIARLVHDASARRDEPFVAIHCGALPENLMESELFGFEKGAFTGADRRKPGRFELAGAGTIFLDEIGEMAAATQVKLLRVLQEREYMRLGGTQLVRAEARVVAATHKDLAAERAAGRFREDLYYRLHVVPIILPPLRERREDIPLLARHFLALVGRAMDAAAEDFSPEIMEIFQDHPWPGNVRELRNLVERMVVLHPEVRILGAACLPADVLRELPPEPLPAAAAGDAVSLQDAVDDFERRLILDALRRARGVQTRAAELLRTTRRILKYRMDRLHIADNEVFPPGD